MKHDIIGRVLKILRIEKRPDSEVVNIMVQPKLEYTEDPTGSSPYTGLEIPHWDFIMQQIELISGASGATSILTGVSPVIDWQNGMATDNAGDPSDGTWIETYGNSPTIQVWLESSPGTFVLMAVPITMTMDGVNIDTITIDTSSTNARIIIK